MNVQSNPTIFTVEPVQTAEAWAAVVARHEAIHKLQHDLTAKHNELCKKVDRLLALVDQIVEEKN